MEKIIREFLNEEITLRDLAIKHNVDKKAIIEALEALGYKVGNNCNRSTIINLKKAIDEYATNPSIAALSKKYHLGLKTIRTRLQELGIDIVNHQNRVRFNESIFDIIDTEAKAYWLGFLYADGHVGTENRFELSLKGEDIEHLKKFNKFMEYDGENSKMGKVKCNGQEFDRCRWSVRNKHLIEQLQHLGCVQKKSLILKFADLSIFTDKSLIRHFIRGYFDGDGCITYASADHSKMEINILGTEQLLNKLQECLNISYKLKSLNKTNNTTKVLQVHNKPALDILHHLYKDSTVYLTRKFEKYQEFCRLYEKS